MSYAVQINKSMRRLQAYINRQVWTIPYTESGKSLRHDLDQLIVPIGHLILDAILWQGVAENVESIFIPDTYLNEIIEHIHI